MDLLTEQENTSLTVETAELVLLFPIPSFFNSVKLRFNFPSANSTRKSRKVQRRKVGVITITNSSEPTILTIRHSSSEFNSNKGPIIYCRSTSSFTTLVFLPDVRSPNLPFAPFLKTLSPDPRPDMKFYFPWPQKTINPTGKAFNRYSRCFPIEKSQWSNMKLDKDSNGIRKNFSKSPETSILLRDSSFAVVAGLRLSTQRIFPSWWAGACIVSSDPN